MSKRWLSLLGIIFAVYLNPPRTSAEHANFDDGDDSSLQGLGSNTHQSMTNNSGGNVISQSANYLYNYTRGGDWHLPSVLAMMSFPDVGSKSDRSVSRAGRDRSVIKDLSQVVREPMSLVWRIATDPLSIVSIVIDWVKEMTTNLTVAVITRSWTFTVNYIIPRLDDMSVKIASFEAVPDTVRSMVMSVHSTYAFMKMFGYLRPA